VCQRLFLLDLPAADDDTNATSDNPANPTLLMLLHILTDVHTNNTMQVHLRLGDVNIHALINSGSTHNLIAEKVASRTGLPMVGSSSTSSTMASGECVPCIGVYRQPPFSINGDQLLADFFMLPLPGYDMVLGTQWPLRPSPCPYGTRTIRSAGS
jgi:hypothetical protein